MENNILLARINDIVETVYKTDKPKFLGFLSNEEKAFVKKQLDHCILNCVFYGGANDCERVFLGCFPDWLEEYTFPITAVTFKYRTVDTLRHRDFLGSLMALGIKRESVGDILIEQGRAVVFLSDDIVDFVLQSVQKIGRVGITLFKGYDSPLPQREQPAEHKKTVASLRLDCVVSALTNCSRNTACELIEGGLVAVNSIVTYKITKALTTGDVLSVRRKGKFELVSSNTKTKIDKILLIYKAY